MVGFQHSIAMKTSPIFLLLSSLRVGVVIASDTQQHNDTDTSAEASINGIGDVELEDLRMSEVIDKIEEALTDGSFGDSDIFEDYASNNGFGRNGNTLLLDLLQRVQLILLNCLCPMVYLVDFPKHARLLGQYSFRRMIRKRR